MPTEFDILIAAAGNAEAIKKQVESTLISVSADKSTDNLKLIEDLGRTLVALGQLCRDFDSLLTLSDKRQERREAIRQKSLALQQPILDFLAIKGWASLPMILHEAKNLRDYGRREINQCINGLELTGQVIKVGVGANLHWVLPGRQRPEVKPLPVTLDIKSTTQIKPTPPIAPTFKPPPKPEPKGRRFRQLSTKEDWRELVAIMMPVHGHLILEEFLKKVRSEAMVYGFESPVVADALLHNMVIGPYRELKKSYRPRNGSGAWTHTFDPEHEPVLVGSPKKRQCLVCRATLNAYNHGKFCSAHTKKP